MKSVDIIIDEDQAPDAPALDEIPLEYPFTVKYRKNNQEREEKITTITLRRATIGDIEEMMKHKDEMAQVRVIVTRLSGIPEAVYRQIDAMDLEKISKKIESFFPQFPSTGGTYSGM